MSARETLKAIHDRGDLLPWLEGKTEICAADTGEKIDSPGFNAWGPEVFTFKPIPEPKYRPWTWAELWERSDCWFRLVHLAVPIKPTGLNSPVNRDHPEVRLEDDWVTTKELLAVWRYLDPTTGEWLPCGVLDQPQ